MNTRLLAPLLLLALGAWEPLRSPDPDVEAGNRAFAAGKWEEAVAHYEAARGSGVDEAALDYNLGTARLKLGAAASGDAKAKLTEQGLADLEKSRRSKDAHLRSEASFNAGNAQLGAEKFQEAIDSYKQSLRDNAENADARANLELALRKLQKQQEQQQQQQQQGQGQGKPPPQGGQGQPQQPPPQGGSGQGQPQQPPPQGGSGQGQPPPTPPDKPENDDAGSGSPDKPPPDSGSGSSKPPPQGNGSNSPDKPKDPGQDPPPDGSGSGQKHGLPSRHRDPNDQDKARTPDDDRLDDLERGSRDLRRGQVRDGTSDGTSDDGASGGVDW